MLAWLVLLREQEANSAIALVLVHKLARTVMYEL
jgi:hypothetical protein